MNNQLIACVDFPKENSILNDHYFLLASGWAINKSNNDIVINIFINNKFYKTITTKTYREDIEKIYNNSGFKNTKKSGWNLNIPAIYLNKNKKNVIAFEFYDKKQKIVIKRKIFFNNYTNIYKRQKFIYKSLVCPLCKLKLIIKNRIYCKNCNKNFYRDKNKVIWIIENKKISNFRKILFNSSIANNPYNQISTNIINKFKNGFILDLGSGYRADRFPNVIQVDITNYPTVDLVYDGNILPFKNNVFDAVISESVLEHVPDPQNYIDEIYRVLKKNGEVIIDSAFLQPLHGYPYHFFNTTIFGLKKLTKKFKEINSGVGPHQKAWISLRWILDKYISFLPPLSKKKFLNMKISEILKKLENDNELKSITDEGNSNLAAGVFFHGKK